MVIKHITVEMRHLPSDKYTRGSIYVKKPSIVQAENYVISKQKAGELTPDRRTMFDFYDGPVYVRSALLKSEGFGLDYFDRFERR